MKNAIIFLYVLKELVKHIANTVSLAPHPQERENRKL